MLRIDELPLLVKKSYTREMGCFADSVWCGLNATPVGGRREFPQYKETSDAPIGSVLSDIETSIRLAQTKGTAKTRKTTLKRAIGSLGAPCFYNNHIVTRS